MPEYVRKISDQQGYGLTYDLWKNFPYDQIFTFKRQEVGIGMKDDFVGFGGILTSTAGQYYSEGNRYKSYQTASSLLTNVAETPTPASVAPTHRGAILFNATSAINDGDEISIQWGGHELTPYGTFPFSVIPSMSKELVFECRFKVATIAANIGNFFIGLAGAAGVDPVATTVPITSSDEFVTTLSLLGFGRTSGSGSAASTTGAFSLVYERASGAYAVKAAGTLVADTYIKAGFRWNAAGNTLKTYVDGVEVSAAACGTGVTGATPWPNDYMTPIIATMQESGSTVLGMQVDWWACAQLV